LLIINHSLYDAYVTKEKRKDMKIKRAFLNHDFPQDKILYAAYVTKRKFLFVNH